LADSPCDLTNYSAMVTTKVTALALNFSLFRYFVVVGR
jgi:hypothetical protein